MAATGLDPLLVDVHECGGRERADEDDEADDKQWDEPAGRVGVRSVTAHELVDVSDGDLVGTSITKLFLL